MPRFRVPDRLQDLVLQGGALRLLFRSAPTRQQPLQMRLTPLVTTISDQRGHCIKVSLLSGSREQTENLCGIAKFIFPKWPEAIWAEWRVHVPQVVAC